MDFMNFMNQINSCGCNTGCGGNNGGNSGNGGTPFGFGGGSGILPWLLLAGLGNNYNNGNNFSGGTLALYPNNYGSGYGSGYGYPYIFPTSPYAYDGLKYKTRKVRQAYMEVPVSTYQVAQPMCQPCYMPYGLGNNGGCPQPTLMNIVPTANGNNNSAGLFGFGNGSGILPLLLLLGLINNNGRGCCCQQPQPRSCGCTTEL